MGVLPKIRIFAQNFSLLLHWIFCHKSPHHNINYVKEGHHNITSIRNPQPDGQFIS